MPTGACGIDCDVCKLRLIGTCSTCGPGKSDPARAKLAAQERLFGGTCAILACAAMNRIDYCMRDCDQFPCDNFRIGPYPFSEGFLNMQGRRLSQRPPARSHTGLSVEIPPDYWDRVSRRDPTQLAALTLMEPHPAGAAAPTGLAFRFLGEPVRVDMEAHCLKRRSEGAWVRTEDPLLELVTLVYLLRVEGVHPLGREMVAPSGLKEGHFFQGPHTLRLDPLLDRFGGDLPGFRRAAEALAGERMDSADAAYRLLPFPRIPLYYLLWAGDGEFPPRISVLFDRTIERCLAADAIWGLVNRVTTALLTGPDHG